MTSDIMARCSELIGRGRELSGRIRYYDSRPSFWFASESVPELQAWIGSVANFFRLTATPDTYFSQECQRIVEDKDLAGGVPFYTVQKLLGLLNSILEEMKAGLLRKAEYIFVATTFDDFIDHAAEYHKAGKKTESSVLVSAVFEDAMRKAATKFGVTHKGESLDSVIDELGKRGHVNPVKVKRYKGIASLRNSALHARWDEFDIKDVGSAINGTRELIEELL
jgi:hypothetical protein